MIREAIASIACDNLGVMDLGVMDLGVMDLQIRPAGPGDAEIVALLARITFVETFGHLFGNRANDLAAYLDHTFAVAKIRNSLGEPDNRYCLALRDGLPIGYAKLKHPSPTPLLPNRHPAQLEKPSSST
jgi:diamine N-acetyltransferase